MNHTFAGIGADVERMFLELDEPVLARLLQAYTRKYGAAAGGYAAKTYPAWRSGAVRLSGQTAARMLEMLPPLLPYATRFEFVKRLRAAKFHRTYDHVHTASDRWQLDLMPAIEKAIAHGEAAALPDSLKQRLTWLADADTAVAEKMMTAAMHDEAIARIMYLKVEFQRISVVLDRVPERHSTTITHTISLPQGDITVHISVPAGSRTAGPSHFKGGAAMSTDLRTLPTGKEVVTGTSRQSITLELVKSLSPEERKQYAGKALDALIEREESDVAMQRRHDAANFGIARDIETARRLDEIKGSDSTLHSEHQTASGTTRITITKQNNKSWMIATVVVAIVVLVLILH